MLIGFGLSGPPAQATFIVTLDQVGSDVVATGSGTINTTGTRFWVTPTTPSITNVGAKVVAPVTSRVFLGKCGNPPADFEDCEWSTDTFQALKGLISGAVRGDDLGKAVRDRIATLNPDMPVAEEADMARAWADAAQAWKNLSTSPAGDATFHNHRWDALQWAYCKSGSASWVIHSIVSRSPEDAVDRVRSMGAEGPKLLDTVLHEDKCPGARGLSGEDRTVLTMLRNVFSPTGVGQRNP